MSALPASSPASFAPDDAEWSDADFDLPEDFSPLSSNDANGRRSSASTWSRPQPTSMPNRPTSLRMSTGPDDVDNEDDDMAAFLAEADEDQVETLKVPRAVLSAAMAAGSSSAPPSIITGTVTRLGTNSARSKGFPIVEADEDWDADLDFSGGASLRRPGALPRPTKPTLVATIAPPLPRSDSSIWDENNDDGDVSTIKVSRLPIPPTTTGGNNAVLGAPANTPLPPSPQPSPYLRGITRNIPEQDELDDDGMESAFELPESLSKLSLRPLSNRSSKATISTTLSSEWSDATTTTTATSAHSDFFESDGHSGKHTLSASPSTDFTTDEEYELDEEEREAKEVEGLVLPETFLPKDLVRILDSKKKGAVSAAADQHSSSSSAFDSLRPAPSKQRSKHADDEDDFEAGLQIGNDSDLSPSRLLRPENGGVGGSGKLRLRPKTMAPSHSLRSSSSRATLTRAHTTLAVPSTSTNPTGGRSMRDMRSPSPQPRRSEESTTSSVISNKASIATLRRTTTTTSSATKKSTTRESATSPPPSFPKSLFSSGRTKQQLSPPPLSHSYSMLTLPRIPGSHTDDTSPSKPVKHQKSTSRLLVTPKNANSARSGAGGGGKDGVSPMRLGRKASLSSLQDAERARDRIMYGDAPTNKFDTVSSQASVVSSAAGSASSSQAGSAGKSSLLPRPPSSSSNGGKAGSSGGGGSARYDAPTASSRAKSINAPAPDPHSLRPTLTSLFLPVPRPTTPIDSPGSARLTMPTLSSRAKSRVPVSAVFGGSNTGAGPSQQASPPSRESSKSPITAQIPRVASPSRLRQPVITTSGGPKLMKKPKTSRAFGDGTELDGMDDLRVEKEKERRFQVVPKGTSNGSRPRSSHETMTGTIKERRGESGLKEKDGTKTGTVKEKRPSASTTPSASSTATIGRRTPLPSSNSTPVNSSSSIATLKRPPSRASTMSDATRPSSAASTSTTGTLLRRKSRMDFMPTSSTTTGSAAQTISSKVSVPVLRAAPSPAAFGTMRRRRASIKTETITQRKPTLIRNLSGVGSPKVVGDMRWNPVTLRWEGNDSALKGFDSPTHSSRPALITQLTGSSVGGFSSPTSGLLAGARIVGNMIFDPTKMCWINRFADEEPDPFADMDDDEDDEDDKDATLGKRRGTAFRARSNTGNIGAPTFGTPLETVTASPARSAASRSSYQSHRSTASASGESQSDNESALHPLSSARSSLTNEDEFDEYDDRVSAMGGSSAPGSPDRRRRSGSIIVRGASTSPIPGVDHAMLEACHVAEARHRSEMRGWFPRKRALSSATSTSRSTTTVGRRRIGIIEEDVLEDAGPIDRSYLFEIQKLAKKQYH